MKKRVLGPISVAALTLGSGALAGAANLCVNPGGSSGCYATISEAVKAAAPGDAIQVAAGTYKEAVVINKAISLTGARREEVIVEATGLPNGIYVDGIDNPGLNNVTISDLTIQNANFEGLLIANASSVTVWNNHIIGNNKSLSSSTGTCPGAPAFETDEGADCGEGVHLSGVDHSTIGKNLITGNSGGILLSDDTGATHDNIVTENTVRRNLFDCGITLASHPPATLTGSNTPLGVFRNTIAGNESIENGLLGAGAGTGLFASVPGTQTYGNVVINNRLIGNHQAGVAMHSHTPNQILQDNKIIGNYIAGNGAETDPQLATPGSVGINIFGVSAVTGTVIAQNVFEDEAFDIIVNTPAQVDIHLNSFPDHGVGVDNLGAGSSNATDNYWGCPEGPDSGSVACATAGGPDVTTTPSLKKAAKPAALATPPSLAPTT